MKVNGKNFYMPDQLHNWVELAKEYKNVSELSITDAPSIYGVDRPEGKHSAITKEYAGSRWLRWDE